MSAGAGALIGAGAGALVGNPFIGFIAGGAIGAAKELKKSRDSEIQPYWEEDYSDYGASLHEDGLDLPPEASAAWDDPYAQPMRRNSLTPQAGTPRNPTTTDYKVGHSEPIPHDEWQAYQHSGNDPYHVPRDSFYR
jgi:hypothetical protein